VYVNYKADSKHWVLDSGCSQHMTCNDSMSTSLGDPGDHDHVTYEDNTGGRVAGLGKIAITKISLSQTFFMLNILALIYFLLLNFVTLD
jgi:hypothetical protein